MRRSSVFGYGYIRDKSEVVPPIAVNFWSFRIMVGAGCLFILFFAVVLAGAYGWPKPLWRDRSIAGLPKWHYWVAIALIPLGYIASESGWLVAEFGRQPWTIQDMLPTWAAVSDLQSSSVMITFFLFLILFTAMLAVEINIRILTALLVLHRVTPWCTISFPALRTGSQLRSQFLGSDGRRPSAGL